MSGFDELDRLGDAIGNTYADCVDRLLVNIARHFKYLQPGEEPGGAFMWQARKLAELGQVNRENVEIIRQMLGDVPAELADGLTRKQSTGLFPASLGRRGWRASTVPWSWRRGGCWRRA